MANAYLYNSSVIIIDGKIIKNRTAININHLQEIFDKFGLAGVEAVLHLEFLKINPEILAIS